MLTRDPTLAISRFAALPWILVVWCGCTTPHDDRDPVAQVGHPPDPQALSVPNPASAPLQDHASPTQDPAHDQTSIRAPEEEISSAKSQLANLTLRLAAARQITLEKTMEADNLRGRESLARAEHLFEKKHWLASIRELNSYLNRIQVPEKTAYLRSHYLLGKGYEGVRAKGKAARAYVRYVAASLDADKTQARDLTEVLERLITLASTESPSEAELSPLLAALAASDLPPEIRPTVLYFVGRSALNHGQPALAAAWLSEAERNAQEPRLKNKVAYLQALLLLSQKAWDPAEEIFLRISQVDNDIPSRDLARLALARIAVHRRKSDLALKLYQQIPEDSPSFYDATFESIYLHIDRQEFDTARSRATVFLERFPESKDALQVRLLGAYLAMRAGDFDHSEQGIKAADQRLGDISQWLRLRFAGRSSVDHTLLRDFLSLSQDSLEPLPTLRDATGLFERISESARRLADVHGEVQNLYYALARVDLQTLRPAWHEREIQLKTIAEEALTIGHKLAGSERLLYQERLDKVASQRLRASEERRTKISASPAIKIPQYGRNRDIARFFKLSNLTADAYQKLRQAEAELSAAQQLTTPEGETRSLQPSRLRELDERRKKIHQDLQKTLRQLRQSKVEILLGLAPFQNTQRFVSQYGMALQEEADVLKDVRDTSNDSSLRLTSDDAALAWAQWEAVMKEISAQLKELQDSVKKGLRAVFIDLENHEQRYVELSGRLKSVNTELERQLGLSVPFLVGQYANLIQDRFSRHRKWRADIEWLKYQKLVEKDEHLSKKLELEQQILKDTFMDLQQGVTQKWAE